MWVVHHADAGLGGGALLPVPGAAPRRRSRRRRGEPPPARVRPRRAHGLGQLAGGGRAATLPPTRAGRGAPRGRRGGDALGHPGEPARGRPPALPAREERTGTPSDAPPGAVPAPRPALRGEPP